MKRRQVHVAAFTIAIPLAIGMGAASAQAPAPPSDLRLFIQEAIEEGVLTPSGGDEAARVPNLDDNASSCEDAARLGFEDLVGLRRYQDLKVYEDELGSARERRGSQEQVLWVKAHLALGLGAEALALIGARDEPIWRYLGSIARLIDGSSELTADVLPDLGSCRSPARVWFALDALLRDQDGSPAEFEAELPSIRDLPVRLRERVAAEAVPVLARKGHAVLARKLLATFDADDSTRLAYLGFLQAILAIETGEAGAGETIESFAAHPRFYTMALPVLLRHGIGGASPQRAAVLDQAASSPLSSRYGAAILDRIRYVLDGGEDWEFYADLALAIDDLDQLGEPEISYVSDLLVQRLSADLEAQDPFQNLAAIETILQRPRLMSFVEETEATELLGLAALRAAELGLRSVSDALASRGGVGGATAIFQSRESYLHGDAAGLYRLADARPDNADINVLAALIAIETGDRQSFERFQYRLQTRPEALLVLIEADAAARRWMVSDLADNAARSVDEPQHQDRLARAQASGSATADGRPRPPVMQVSELPQRLRLIAAALGAPQEGARQ